MGPPRNIAGTPEEAEAGARSRCAEEATQEAQQELHGDPPGDLVHVSPRRLGSQSGLQPKEACGTIPR